MNINIPTVLERTKIFYEGNVGTKHGDLLLLISNHSKKQAWGLFLICLFGVFFGCCCFVFGFVFLFFFFCFQNTLLTYFILVM